MEKQKKARFDWDQSALDMNFGSQLETLKHPEDTGKCLTKGRKRLYG